METAPSNVTEVINGEDHENVALVAGVTGLVGTALVEILVKAKWKVYGVARAPQSQSIGDGVQFIACDLTDRNQTLERISPLWDVTHVFWVTWAAHLPDNSLENYEANRDMFCNALDALIPNSKALKHICLQTGTKHYYSLGSLPPGSNRLPLAEDTPRLPNEHNFYYALEDVLLDNVKKRKNITWSVHRPGLIFGQSARSFFNVIGSLAVYATICKFLDLSFVFPGSRTCWEEAYMDASDARLIAQQELWAATDPRAQNQAFNTINGDAFTWKQLWPVLAAKFDLQAVNSYDESLRLVDTMSDKGGVWDEAVQTYSLCPTKMQDLADWWFMDSLFRVPFKMLASSKKCREYGFYSTRDTQQSLVYWIDRMRETRLIP